MLVARLPKYFYNKVQEARNMLNETNITCFLSLCETLSFTETARRLYLTQQAVSKNVMQLEADIGVPLLNRSWRNVVLTEEGLRCEAMFRQMQDFYTSSVASIRRDFEAAHKTLKIGFQNFLELGAEVVRANEKMRKKHPDVSLQTVRYSPGVLAQKLYEGSVDLAVMYARYVPENPDYQKKSLFSTFINVMVSSGNPLVSEDATYLDFRDEPYIMDAFPDEPEKTAEERARREMALCGLTPSSIIIVPNRESAYMTAEMRGGILLGSDISQISGGKQLLKYRTEVKDFICCVWRGSTVNAVRDKYADLLSREYSETGYPL